METKYIRYCIQTERFAKNDVINELKKADPHIVFSSQGHPITVWARSEVLGVSDIQQIQGVRNVVVKL